MSRIARRNVVPVNQITPLTYRDGVTYIQMLTELSEYVKSILHPSLQHTVDQLVSDVETQMDKHHDQYVDGVQEFQRIHDAFMADVNAKLIALNDGAVSDLVKDDTSLLGQVLRDVFTSRDSFTELSDTITYRVDRLTRENESWQNDFQTGVDNRFDELGSQLDTRIDNISALQYRVDARRKVAHHTEYGVEDVDTLRAAIAVLPSDTVLTIPETMVFDVGADDELVIDRPVAIRGGMFYGTGHVIRVTSDNVQLEDMVVYGDGNDQRHHTLGSNAVSVLGTTERPLQGIQIRNVTVRDVGYTGIRLTHVDNFVVEHNTIRNFRYAGIALSSAKNGVCNHNDIAHAQADAGVNWNSYGISVSNSTSLSLEHRSENIDVMFNRIHDIPHWEGIDTHNGRNVSMMFNRVTACRRGIALVANMTEPLSGPTECRVIGNSIDGTGSSQQHFTEVIGITMGGNADNTRKSDAVITENTIINTPYPVVFRYDRPERYTWDKCVVHSNTGDPGQLVAGTTFDTGWIGIGNHMVWGGGVGSAGDYQFRIRVVSDGEGFTTYFRGAVTRSNASNLLFRVQANLAHLVPGPMAFGHQDRHIIGTVETVRSAGGRALLCVEPDRRIRFFNVKGDITANDNLFIDGVMRS